MAANKEAIAIVLDVGPSMNNAPPGETTALQASLTAITSILQRKMFAESKDEVAIVLCGTTDTNNELSDGKCYTNISVARPVGVVDWDLLQFVQNKIQPSTVSGDFVDAIVVGMDHVVKGVTGKRGFGSKRIILFSDVGGEFGDDGLDDIIASMKEANVEFNVIGPDLDDDDDEDEKGGGDGPKGAANGHVKEKTPQQRAGETLLRHIIEEINGESYSFNEALPALSYFQSRQVRPTAWKCQLEIGPDLKIPIAGYIKVKEAKPKSYKNVYAKDADSSIERMRTYHLNDDEETEVEQSDTVVGHRYGSTLVPFSEDDLEAMKFRAEKCFKVLGFTDSKRVKRSHYLGDYCMTVVADKGDEAAGVALSALINALYETNHVIIVRRNYSAAASPRLGVLTPHIKANYECLFYNELPFSEDIRQYTFGSLPLKEDNETANKKFEPSSEQLDAMDELIDSMDLTKAAVDEDGDAVEALKPKLTFNPHLQRLYQCLQHRALNPDDALPELSPLIANCLKPPQEIQTKCEDTLDKMKKIFKLEVVEKKKEDQTGANVFKDEGASDEPAAKKAKVDDSLKGGMADIVKTKITEVGTVNPVDDFKAIIGEKEEDRFEDACKMMQKRIIQIVMDSFGTQFYGKAMDCLKAYKEESIKNSEPKFFNNFLKEFKESLAEKGRKDFWEQIVTDKVGLITKMDTEESNVSKEEADKFMEGEVKKEPESEPTPAADADDLLDELA